MYRALRRGFFLGGVFLAGAAAARAADKSGYSLVHPVPAALLRELNTDRPDQTESPYTVDAGHLQVEMDLANFTSARDGASRTREWSVAPLNLKVGLTDRLDVQLLVEPLLHSRVADRAAGTVARASGFGDVTTRLKFNCWGDAGGATAFAVMPFVKWPLPASGVRNGETEGGIIFALGYTLPAGWESAAMTEVDWIAAGAGGRGTAWINSITFSHRLTARLGGYGELFTVVGDTSRGQGQVDVGLTCAVSANTQLDLGCNFGVTRSAPDYQPFAGISRRF